MKKVSPYRGCAAIVRTMEHPAKAGIFVPAFRPPSPIPDNILFPLSPKESARRLCPHDEYASDCGTLAQM